MLSVRIIPCLDCRDNRVVKGVRFSNLRDAGDPALLAQVYQQQGADEIVLLDIAATPEGRANQVETVKRVREALSIPLTVGGGIKTIADAERLLSNGADKVSINTAAVLNPSLIDEMARQFGSQCVVLAIDATLNEGEYRVVIQSGGNVIKKNVFQWAKEACSRGIGEILATSFDRDGTRQGYDLTLMRSLRLGLTVPLIASGGADSVDHLCDAVNAGADAILAASIFHDGDLTVAEVKRQMAEKGFHVRQ